jgi:phosphoesterase RecJ-like protein
MLLQARALSSLSFVDASAEIGGGNVALMRLRASDFTETGALLEETSGLVNVPMEIASVRASVLVVEDAAAGVTKLSFRSKPPAMDGRFIDVNELAARFGGGGHVHAAGAKQRASIDAVAAAVADALRR